MLNSKFILFLQLKLNLINSYIYIIYCTHILFVKNSLIISVLLVWHYDHHHFLQDSP